MYADRNPRSVHRPCSFPAWRNASCKGPGGRRTPRPLPSRMSRPSCQTAALPDPRSYRQRRLGDHDQHRTCGDALDGFCGELLGVRFLVAGTPLPRKSRAPGGSS